MAKKFKDKKTATTSTTTPITPEWMAGVMSDIVISPIPEAYKAMFLYAIAQGTFNQDLHQRFIELLAEQQIELAKHEEALLQQVAQLQQENKILEQELTSATLGACREIEAAVDHIERRAVKEIERRGSQREAGEIEGIREKLKKRKT